jgi:glycosyltransferase involved in cell wall biosynthesis
MSQTADHPPAVSVVIPTFRREDCIEETLASVFAQTFRDFEVIVINDGSPDQTAARLRPLVESGRIRYYEQPNSGQSAARNRGIGLARGEFLALLDDDDLWPPDKLEWQVARLRANPRASLCYGYAKSFGLEENYRLPAGPGPQGDVGLQLVRECPISSPGQTLARTKIVQALGGLDASIHGAEDWDLWIRLGQAGEFIYEERLSLHYRQHSVSVSQNPHKMFKAGMQVLHKHAGKTPFGPRWRLWLQARKYVGLYTSVIALGQVGVASRQNASGLALKRLGSAVRFYPLLPGTRRFWRMFFECTPWFRTKKT